MFNHSIIIKNKWQPTNFGPNYQLQTRYNQRRISHCLLHCVAVWILFALTSSSSMSKTIGIFDCFWASISLTSATMVASMTHYAMTYYFLFDTRKDLCTHRSKNSEIVVISAAAMFVWLNVKSRNFIMQTKGRLYAV